MVSATFDTNILIDCLRGYEQAASEIERWPQPSISIVTWAEVLAGAPAQIEEEVASFLDQFQVIYLDREIGRIAARLRRDTRLKLPDAVVLATALSRGDTLVTRDTKAFGDLDGVHIPYAV